MKKKNLNYGETHKKAEVLLAKAEDPWWAHPAVIVFLTISLSVADALVLFSVLDIAMTQSEYMGYIMSFTIALVLNFIPLLVAKFIHQAIYKTKKFAMLWAIIGIAAFVILFLSTVYLRFAYQDNFGKESEVQLVNQVSTMVEEVEIDESENDNQKSSAVVLLLCLEPLVTSIVNFCLAYLSDDEIRKRLNQLRMRKIEITEEINELKAAILIMENIDIQRMYELDEERYQIAVEEVETRCNLMKAISRNILAEHLANPAAISKLSVEMADR